MGVEASLHNQDSTHQIDHQLGPVDKRAGKGWAPGTDLRAAVAMGLVLGLVISLQLPPQIEPLTRAIIYWDTFIVVMLFAQWRIIGRSSAELCRTRARADDPGNFFILFVSVFGSIAGLAGAIISIDNPDQTMKRLGDGGIVAMVFIAVIGGGLLMQTSYTLHYPRIYYADSVQPGGLAFPGSEPDDLDFAYFAFGVGMTFQVADVAVTSKRMRHVVLKQSLLSFWYNLAIIALLINVVAGHI